MSKVAVVTGASAGVGRAVVREYARNGYDVGLIARGTEGLEAARREVEALGRRAVAVPTDVADADAVDRAAERIETELGEIAVWTNVAFSNVFAEFTELTPAEYQRITDVTYLGYVWGTMSALKRMLPRNRGVVVQIGSALAYRSIPLQAAYCGAKSAIRGFTDSIRCELHHRKSKVRITMVQLPAVNTPQFTWCRSKLPRKAQPVPPIYQPEVIARGVLYAAEHERRELWIGWSAVEAIIGQKLIPGLLDRYLGATGYDSQQYDGSNPGGPGNLDTPLPGDFGAHGAFDARARTWSSQLWVTTHRGWVAAALVATAALGISAAARR
ncbi:MAG TPA: SDR family oxidoreductase [Candidatus Elarobacter sp.]|jgi:NAD(P)-dependent dehydrogenase (short-subunit alcohol dehydrogenase family)|nr:SDR family oxidoreductase [Candidatus Elarobacter sp.]